MKDLLTDSENKDDDYDLLDEPSNFKNIFLIAFAFIILLAFGFIFYYFVSQSDEPTKRNPISQTDVPLLSPSRALKEIPKTSTGLKIPNQDQQVFDVIENPTQPETAVPEEEVEPTPTPAPETENTNLLPPPEEPQLETEPSQNVEHEPSPTPEFAPAPEPKPEPEASTDGDKKLRIEFLESDVEQPEPITGGLQIEIPDEPVIKPEPAPEAEVEVEVEPEPTPEPETQAPSVGYIAQLSASDNTDSAKLLRNTLLTEFPSLLSEDNLIVEEGLLSDGNAIFRLQTIPLELDEARTLCSALNEQGRDCFIKRAP